MKSRAFSRLALFMALVFSSLGTRSAAGHPVGIAPLKLVLKEIEWKLAQTLLAPSGPAPSPGSP
jgi:hypothetical protein